MPAPLWPPLVVYWGFWWKAYLLLGVIPLPAVILRNSAKKKELLRMWRPTLGHLMVVCWLGQGLLHMLVHALTLARSLLPTLSAAPPFVRGLLPLLTAAPLLVQGPLHMLVRALVLFRGLLPIPSAASRFARGALPLFTDAPPIVTFAGDCPFSFLASGTGSTGVMAIELVQGPLHVLV